MRRRGSNDEDFVSNSKLPASEGWFRRRDLNEYSKPWLVFEAIFGGLVGFATSGLILLYAVVHDFALIPLFLPGVTASTILLAGVGVLRNRILRYVAARGFKAAFHFRTVAFEFYIIAIVSGAIGLGYGYGYVSPQSTGMVLPFAGLFVLFIYLYLLWGKILVRLEEGRLCIFQFLVEHSQNGRGYSWLKRGLSVAESRLQIYGVSVKRNRLFFGFSYSLFEGSVVESDLDKLYLLGDWPSQLKDLNAIHDIVSWFLSRTAIANVEGFSGTTSLGDYILEILGTITRKPAGAIAFGAAMVTIILGVMQLLQRFGLLH